MITIPALPPSLRRQLRGLLGNTTGEMDTIKALAIAGFVFAHVMVWRDFNANRHFDFPGYAVALGVLLGTVAGSIRLRGDHDTPDTPQPPKP